MKVEIIVGRNGLPAVGQVRDYAPAYAQSLIDNGLAKAADGKQVKKTVNKPKTEGNTDEQKGKRDKGC